MMSREEIFTKLAGHWWKVMHGAQIISMGSDGGKLVCQFEQDGSFSFPSTISFLPSERLLWRWNKNQQVIEVLTIDGILTQQFLPPHWDGAYYVLEELVISDKTATVPTTYRCEPQIENIIQEKWAPDPILNSSGLSLTGTIPICLKSRIENQEIDDTSFDEQIETISIINEFSSFDFWQTTYGLMRDHFFWSNIAVLSPQIGKSVLSDLNNICSDIRIYVDSQSMIVGVVGPRYLLIELIGEVIFQYQLGFYSSKIRPIETVILSVANQYFIDKMIITKI